MNDPPGHGEIDVIFETPTNPCQRQQSAVKKSHKPNYDKDWFLTRGSVDPHLPLPANIYAYVVYTAYSVAEPRGNYSVHTHQNCPRPRWAINLLLDVL